MLKNNRYLRIYLLTCILLGYPFLKLHCQDLVIDSITFSTGQHFYFSPGTITSPDIPSRPVLITGDAQVEFKAAHYVHLKCGFSTSLSNSGGTFHAYIGNQVALLNLKVFIEGYYIGGGQMTPTLFNEMIPGATDAMVDTVTVEAYDQNTIALVDSYKAILDTGGNVTGTFSTAAINTSYYFAIRHRNALFTWTANPVLLTSVTNYNFTLTPLSAFGNNETGLSDGRYGMYSGDVNGDEYIDTGDVTPVDNDNLSGLYSPGGYWITDINGDGYVDTGDVTPTDNNNLSGIYSQHP